jgi:hypothetical protein
MYLIFLVFSSGFLGSGRLSSPAIMIQQHKARQPKLRALFRKLRENPVVAFYKKDGS